MKTFAELCKGDLILFRNENGDETRGIVEHVSMRDENGEITVKALDTFEWIKEAAYIRHVKLDDIKACKAPYDMLVYHAAVWLAEHGDITDVVYMLGNKIHKYLDEAWLGGCNNMEVDNA